MDEQVTAFYKPGELARMFGVSPQCVRVWEEQGKISPAVRTLGNHRRFTQTHVDQIKQLQESARQQREGVNG